MIVLDTNVVSEITRATPDPAVLGWVDARPATELAITAITASELLHGVERLPDGQRKARLGTAVRMLIEQDFRGRVLPFDGPAAASYAQVVSVRERLGRPISAADAQIAAICRARGTILATRNTKDFDDTGIELVDPWQQH